MNSISEICLKTGLEIRVWELLFVTGFGTGILKQIFDTFYWNLFWKWFLISDFGTGFGNQDWELGCSHCGIVTKIDLRLDF